LIKTQIADGKGSGDRACVTIHNALCVAQITPDVPEIGELNRMRYLKGKLGEDGLDDGNTDLTVDGSAPSVDFFVKSDNDFDIHIMVCEILIAALQVPLNRFGNIAGGLATGFDLRVIEGGIETFIMEKATTNGETIIQSGDAAAATQLTAYLANSDAWVIRVPLSEFVPDGLRLGRGTLDRFVATVNDDLTVAAIDLMEVAVFGYRHIP
jgi:hypothetical protein